MCEVVTKPRLEALHQDVVDVRDVGNKAGAKQIVHVVHGSLVANLSKQALGLARCRSEVDHEGVRRRMRPFSQLKEVGYLRGHTQHAVVVEGTAGGFPPRDLCVPSGNEAFDE